MLTLQGDVVTFSSQMLVYIMFGHIICSFDICQYRLPYGSFAVRVNKNSILIPLTYFAPRKIEFGWKALHLLNIPLL